MDEATIRSVLQDVFRDVFDDSSIGISRQTTARDIESWDSFNHVRLIVAAEEEFGISFSTAEIADLRNAGELMDLIARHLSEKK
jgi:acyl carrier protein